MHSYTHRRPPLGHSAGALSLSDGRNNSLLERFSKHLPHILAVDEPNIFEGLFSDLVESRLFCCGKMIVETLRGAQRGLLFNSAHR